VEAAAEELLGKGNAVDAVVAGVFAACAASPGVLLGPVQILVGGAGAGLLAIDGRVRQPGMGAPRPRGFVDDEEIPDAARVGAPWLPAALSVAIATAGSATFAQVLAPAIAAAKGSPRQDILSRIASRGPRAIEERPLGQELVAVAGRPSGGLLTSDDLSSPRLTVQKATSLSFGEQRIVLLPWANHDEGGPVPPAGHTEIARARAVVAVDRNATFAIACWDEPVEGLDVAELGLRAPFYAEPVRRGQTRVRAGDARPAAAPLALVAGEAPRLALAAFGAGDAYDVVRGALASIVKDDRIEARGDSRLVAMSHANGTASAFRS
jgi:gamma-glutamyltranspeptidase/glutathione hydrolase